MYDLKLYFPTDCRLEDEEYTLPGYPCLQCTCKEGSDGKPYKDCQPKSCDAPNCADGQDAISILDTCCEFECVNPGLFFLSVTFCYLVS